MGYDGLGGNADGDGGQIDDDAGDCVTALVSAEIPVSPTDIIVVVDNSISMGQEATGIESNLRVALVELLEGAGVDTQIIMLTHHGTATTDVCIPAPLSGTSDCTGPPVAIPGKFRHYSIDVQSHNSLCRLIDSYPGPIGGGVADDFNQEPNGWSEWLRTEALKVVVEISDDGALCTSSTLAGTSYNDGDDATLGAQVADSFDSDLRGLSPEQFGTAAARNYVFYSVVGMADKIMAGEPYAISEPVQTATCMGGVGPGTAYQSLSILTGRLRFAGCQDVVATYDVVFRGIADELIRSLRDPCTLALPAAPPGQSYDIADVGLIYLPVGGPGQLLEQVASESECTETGFYIADSTAQLCAAICNTLRDDVTGELEFRIECGFVPGGA